MTERRIPTEIDDLVDEEAKKTGLPAELIKEAVRHEIAVRAAKRIAHRIEVRDRPTFVIW